MKCPKRKGLLVCDLEEGHDGDHRAAPAGTGGWRRGASDNETEATLPDGRVFVDGVETIGVRRLVDKPVTTFGAVDLSGFHEWFVVTAADDASMVWAKAREYGRFTITAEALGVLTGQDQARLNSEAVLATNVAQKLNRIMEALFRGELPSEDCWRDLACYAMLARRIRLTKGAWPA